MNYLYNGAELPELPEHGKYAVIHTLPGIYMVTISEEPVPEGKYAYGVWEFSWQGKTYSLSESEWVYQPLITSASVDADNVVWTSHDLRLSDGTLFMDGSEPIPVGASAFTPDPISMTMGWLVGRRIAGQRGKQIIPDEPEQTPVTYLSFASAEPFTIGIANAKKNWDGALYYSVDAEAWNEWDGTITIESAEHSGEQKIYVRGSGNTVITGSTGRAFVLTGTGIRCDGNIENLLDYETVLNGEHPVMANACYRALFMGNTALVSAPELPAMAITNYCYHSMFRDCSSLQEAPELPATTLGSECYPYMFSGCTSLTKAPSVLPATVLTLACYHSLLAGCKLITHAPKIMAETLAKNCFMYTFSGCTSMVTLPKLPIKTLAEGCYQNMFNGCSNIKLSEVQTDEYNTPYSIPYGGDGTDYEGAMKYMFNGTGGTFKGTPGINTTYYTSNTVV